MRSRDSGVRAWLQGGELEMEILFLQRPDVLPGQRELVASRIAELEGARLHCASSPDEARQYTGAEVLLCPTLPWLPEVIEALPRLRWIHFLSAGVDRIWEMPFDKTRYLMSKSVGVHAHTISEFVIGAILHALKGFGVYQLQQQRREWKRFHLDECAGKTLGIVGIGTIGARLAQLAAGFGMRVVGTVNTPREIPYVDVVYDTTHLDDVLAQSDFVVLLVPLTPATRGLLSARELRLMKRTAWLINVARGEVVDEGALVEVLRRGGIAGAVLDVFEEEPLPAESPLWELENVLITPHVAGTTQHYMPRALEIFADNYRRYLATGELTTPVSVARGY